MTILLSYLGEMKLYFFFKVKTDNLHFQGALELPTSMGTYSWDAVRGLATRIAPCFKHNGKAEFGKIIEEPIAPEGDGKGDELPGGT